MAGAIERTRAVIGGVPNLVGATYAAWRRHRTIRLGAGIAYYGLFAVVPILAISLAVAGLFVNSDDVQAYVAEVLTRLFDADAEQVAAGVADALDNVTTTTTFGLVGVVSLVFTASLLVVALQDAFDTIWEVPVQSGLRHTLLRRLLAFVVVLSSGAVIVASFAVNAVTSLLARLLPDRPAFAPIPEAVGLAAAWALGITALALLLRFLPRGHVPWRAAWIGGAITALFVALGTSLIGAYLRRFGSSSLAGATGSVFLVLVWFYYEAQIILAGAELTRVLDRGSVGDDREACRVPGQDAAVDVGD